MNSILPSGGQLSGSGVKLEFFAPNKRCTKKSLIRHIVSPPHVPLKRLYYLKNILHVIIHAGIDVINDKGKVGIPPSKHTTVMARIIPKPPKAI